MGTAVFANQMSIACKADDGKSMAAMPDVCLSPPSPPAGPIPIPYPNTASASDTDKGSKTVQIGGKEVMLKDKSVFKTSTGNEAATKSFGMGVVTHQIQGETSFVAWSMDVKFEGENVPRHLDLTMHNEMCIPANTPTWPYLSKMSVKKMTGPCMDEIKNEKQACSKCQPYGKKDPCKDSKCQEARKCMMVPYDAPRRQLPKTPTCCDGTTGHHAIPVGEFCLSRGEGSRGSAPLNSDVAGYNLNLAPTVCAEGSDHKEKDPKGRLKEHGLIGSEYIAARVRRGIKNNQQDVKYDDLAQCGAESVNAIFPHCSIECIKKQLDRYHVDSAKIPKNDPVCQASQQSDYAVKKPKVKRI
jgi:Toxin PAAR-like domain/GHH signature containing HNH/Endo VII superfamily nuclease toxin  2